MKSKETKQREALERLNRRRGLYEKERQKAEDMLLRYKVGSRDHDEVVRHIKMYNTFISKCVLDAAQLEDKLNMNRWTT